MACGPGGCGGPGSFGFEHDANNRQGGPYVDRSKRAPRRRAFFSRGLYEASLVMQNPSMMTVREFVIAVFALFALYRGVFALAALKKVLLGTDMAMVCRGLSAMGCVLMHFWLMGGVLVQWVKEVVPWGCIAVLAVFFGEEAVRAWRKKSVK